MFTETTVNSRRSAIAGLASLFVIGMLAIAACGGGSGDAVTPVVPSTTAPASLPAVPDEMVDRIPDGMYRKVVTTADGESLGLDAESIAAFLGTDGEMPIGLLIVGDSFEILVTNDAQIEEVGAVGGIEYDQDGRLVMVEECCGRTTIAWTFADGLLVTTAADSDAGPLEPDAVLVNSGAWVLEGSVADDGPAGDRVTLTFANPLSDLPPQIISFAAEARDASGEVIEWDVRQSAGPEADIISAVLAGDVDVAWVGARSFPEYDALLAPMLVDSYEIQTAAFERGIVDRMSEALGERGIVVLGVYPGPLQRVIGVPRPILTADDFIGTEIALFDVPLQRVTMETLDARPAEFEEYMDVSDLDGFIVQLAAVTGNSYENEVAAVSANLNLWPRPLVVFMSAERLARLESPIREALRSGAEAAFQAAATATLHEDGDALDFLCDATAQLVEVRDADLTEIRARLTPVYADLAQDPAIAAFLGELEALKQELGVPPTAATCDRR